MASSRFSISSLISRISVRPFSSPYGKAELTTALTAAATKEEITSSGTLVAALLFRNVYGTSAERALDVFVALSALGNVLAVVCVLYAFSRRLSYLYLEQHRSFLKAVLTKNWAVRVSYHSVSSGAATVPSMHP